MVSCNCDFWTLLSDNAETCIDEIGPLAPFGESVKLLSSTEGRVSSFVITDTGEYEFGYSDVTELWGTTITDLFSISKMESIFDNANDVCSQTIPGAAYLFHSTTHRIIIPYWYWDEPGYNVLKNSCTLSDTLPSTLEEKWIAEFTDKEPYSSIHFSDSINDVNNNVNILTVVLKYADTTTESFVLYTVDGINWNRVLITAIDSNDNINGIYTVLYNTDYDTGGFLVVSNNTTGGQKVDTSNNDGTIWTPRGVTLSSFDGSTWTGIDFLHLNSDTVIAVAKKDTDGNSYYCVFTNYGTVFSHKFTGPYPVQRYIQTPFAYDNITGTLFALFPVVTAGLWNEDNYTSILHYSSDWGLTWHLVSDFSFDEYFDSYFSFQYTTDASSAQRGQYAMKIHEGYLTITGALGLKVNEVDPWGIFPVAVQYKISEIT